MSKQDIAEWLKYWKGAKMVNFEEIRSQADMHEARRFCACMRKGLFTDVTDNALWYVLRELRFEWGMP